MIERGAVVSYNYKKETTKESNILVILRYKYISDHTIKYISY